MVNRSFNIFLGGLVIIKIVHLILNISCCASNMNNYSSSVITGPTATAGLALENAQSVYKRCGREESLVALMNSMHKTGIGFREVEEAVAKVQQLKWQTKGVNGEGKTLSRNEEEVKRIMKGKLRSVTKDWRKTLAEKQEARALLVEELGGEKTKRFKKTLRKLRVAEDKEKSVYTRKYTQKYEHLKAKYKKKEQSNEDPILEGYPGVCWSDNDLSNRLSRSK